jgi:hypothetical protein
MQAVGWAIADNLDYATPIINEWTELEMGGFPQQPQNVPFDQAWYDGWMAGYAQALVDPLDEFSLYMLFSQPEPIVPEEEYVWDPEPIWQAPTSVDPNPLQGYAIPDYMIHYAEDELEQDNSRALGDHVSTFNSIFDSVCEANHDPCSYIVAENSPLPDISYPNNRDCSIMVMDLVPPPDLWDVDEIVNIQVGSEVWTVNRSLAEGGLWDVPYINKPEPVVFGTHY